MILFESLLHAFTVVLGREEVDRICNTEWKVVRNLKLHQANIHETLIEAAITRWIERQDDLAKRESEKGLRYGRDEFEAIYSDILSQEECNQVWKECESISRTLSLSTEQGSEGESDTPSC